jgi:hypothetical protein
MADPFSIVATVIGLAATGAKGSKLIYNFTSEVINAPSSLQAVSNELSVLCKVFNRLELSLKEDFDFVPPFSEDMSRELREVLNSCRAVFNQLERTVIKFLEKKKKGGLYDFQTESSGFLRRRILRRYGSLWSRTRRH